MTSAGKEALVREESTEPGWFQASKEELIPLINECNESLVAVRSSSDLSLKLKLKLKCINARNNVKDAIKAVKSKWIATLAERMKNINNTLKYM